MTPHDNHIAAFRRARGLTQAMLAEKVGVSPAAVSTWESGTRSPSLRQIGRLADALGVPPASLLSGDSRRSALTSLLSENARLHRTIAELRQIVSRLQAG